MPHPTLRGQAALALLVNPRGKVLAISRDHDTADWGIPGGTAEPGIDTNIADTAFRELYEETGVVAEEISFLHAGQSGTHRVTTFLVERVVIWPARFRSTPFEGHVGWVDPQVLVAPTCRYRAHARMILEKADVL